MLQGRIQVFKLGGAHLKKSRRAEGGAKIFGVFRVKNHDLTTKNHIFSNCGGRRENIWDISCEKSRFYAKKSFFSPILWGARAGCTPLDPPLLFNICNLAPGNSKLLSMSSIQYNTIQYNIFIPIRVPQGAITNIHS